MKKSLFIHIPKNGGTSLRNTMSFAYPSMMLNKQNVRSELEKFGLLPSFGHVRLIDYDQEQVKKKFRPFCIIRNPWSREVSKYMFMLSARNNPDDHKTENRRKLLDEYGDSFHDYVTKILPLFDNCKFSYLHACETTATQVSYIRGKVIPDYLRFEHYNKEIEKYFKLKVTKHMNKMEKYDYKDYYTEELKQIVYDRYREDIDYWGYDFKTSATDNHWSKYQ